MVYGKLLNQLSRQLNEIESQNQDISKQAKLSIIVCRDILSQMNQTVLKNSFQNDDTEINFFKKVKLVPLTQLVYYSEVLTFEGQYPKASKEEQIKYIKKKIKKLNKFYGYNLDFIQYVREDYTHFDELYYTRVNCNSLNFTNTKFYYRTPEFSTSHDILLGKVKGFDLFVKYLRSKLHQLQNINPLNITNSYQKSNLHWTSTKTALTELIYALHSCGAINNGTADIKEIAIAIEKLFNIDLKDYYRTFIEIRARKIQSTKFIDQLKQSLLKRMEESDD